MVEGDAKAVDEATEKLSDAFSGEAAITAISEALSTRWKELHDDKTDTDPSLRLVSKRFEEVVAHIQSCFSMAQLNSSAGLTC